MGKIKDLLSQEWPIKLLFFSVPLLSLLMVEFAARCSLAGTLLWVFGAPAQFLLSLVLFYALYLIVWANVNHKGVTALICSVVWIFVSLAIGCKKEVLGTLPMPWDFLLGGNIAGLLGDISLAQFKFFLNVRFLLFVLVHLALVCALFLFQRTKRFTIPQSILTTAAGLAVIVAVVLTLPRSTFETSPSVLCGERGYVRGFVTSALMWRETEKMSVMADGELQYEFSALEATAQVKPNVIFIMSEAFWDVTLLPGVTFSKDPIPNFHALAKQGISGEMVSPTYGGLTCNVEFEIMTGFSLKYLPYQTNAYVTSVKRALPSLPAYLKEQGYSTVAVHPYAGSFFGRETIYPLLGIDRFVTQAQMPNAPLKGAFVSDDAFADYIISEYEKAAKPVFMFNISMQNHWPYTTEDYYDNYDVEVQAIGELDRESLTSLKNFTQGICDADRSLKKIVDYFATVEQPTVLVFLGDHLPALTEQLEIYKRLGFIDESDIDDFDLFKGGEGTRIESNQMLGNNVRILKTPYLIWSNCKSERQEGVTLSANYLGVYTLAQTGLALPPFYNFLLDYMGKAPVNRHALTILEGGEAYRATPPIFYNYEEVYKRVQNDMLFGEQKLKGLFEVN